MPWWGCRWRGSTSGTPARGGRRRPRVCSQRRDFRRDTIDRAVRVAFSKAKGRHGSPRLHADLVDDGWRVSEKTVADSMRRQGLVARKIRRRNGLTRQDKTKAPFPDLVKRKFTADRPNAKWVGTSPRSAAGWVRPAGSEAVFGDRDRPVLPPAARGRPPRPTRTRNWRVRRSGWRWPPGVGSMRSTGPAGARTSAHG